MAATKEFHGKPLISSIDGKKLGEIKDVYLDQDATKIVAVYLGKSGIINRKSLIIEMGYITLMGIDACFVAGSDRVVATEEGDETRTWILAGSLVGREVQTDGGTKIGTVADVIVDDQYKVLGFSLDWVYVQGPLAETRSIARGAMTSLGNDGGPMIAVMEQAEKLKLSSA
jgi:sporulation protein YlmC with PRC-barrel domain